MVIALAAARQGAISQQSVSGFLPAKPISQTFQPFKTIS
jgi:hypothetical protein